MKKTNKIIVMLIMAFLFCLSVNLSCLAQDNIFVFVNNHQVKFDQQLVTINGRTLVPLRAIFEALNTDTEWDGKTQTVVGTKADIKVSLTIGNTTAYVNNVPIQLDVPATIINGRTVVPVRFIAETMKCNVGFQEKTHSIYITDGYNKPIRNLSVHYIDVGQADSILIMLPNGKNMLIDAGNNNDSSYVTDYIKSKDIGTIDYLIGTHPHEDHIGGLDNVINVFDIRKVYLPKVSTNTKTYEDVLTAINQKCLKINTAKAGINIIDENGLKIDIIAPVNDTYSDANDYSAVIKLTYLNKSLIFMGDAGNLSESEITADVQSNIIKIGHHGSSTATSEQFVKHVSPEKAIISVGKDNAYGHPHNEILRLLKNSKIEVYRTDEVGTIVVNSDGNNLSIDKNASEININAPPNPVGIKYEQSKSTTESNLIVYITKTGTKYHNEGCRSLSRSKIGITIEEAKKKYTPCSICKPPQWGVFIMKVIIDRFEGNFAIVEMLDKTMVNIPTILLPKAVEGDIVNIFIDKKATLKRKDDIEKIMNCVWED